MQSKGEVFSILMLLTGPIIVVIVLWQIHCCVSHKAIIESEPPVARYRAIGCSSAERQLDVWPLSANSRSWSYGRRITGSKSGYDRMRMRPSAVVTNTFWPLQQKDIWFVCTGCWCDARGVEDVGESTKMLSDYLRDKLASCWRKSYGKAHLVTNNQGPPVWRPSQRERILKTLNLIETILCPNVPELDDAVAAHAAQLGVLGRVEGHLLNGC